FAPSSASGYQRAFTISSFSLSLPSRRVPAGRRLSFGIARATSGFFAEATPGDRGKAAPSDAMVPTSRSPERVRMRPPDFLTWVTRRDNVPPLGAVLQL